MPDLTASLRCPAVTAARVRRGPLVSLACALCVLCAQTPAAVAQQSGQLAALPMPGDEVLRSLARGQADDWQIALAAAEYVQIDVEALDVVLFAKSGEWPTVTMTAPDGAVVYASAEPNVTMSVDIGPRMVVSFIAERAGPYRLRVAAGDPSTAASRYRLRVVRRGVAIEADRQRLVAHRLWGEGMRLFLEGAGDARRASVATFDEAARVLAAIGDDEGEAMTLGSIATVWYLLSDFKQGIPVAARAAEIWKRMGREREEGIALSDQGLMAYLGYDHASARTFYEQALVKHRAMDDPGAEAMTLVRSGWTYFAAGDQAKVIELNQLALPLWQEVGDTSGESVSLNDLGRAYLDIGEVSQSLGAYQRVLSMRPPERNPRGAAVVMIRIGQLYLSVADWQRAFDSFNEALALTRRASDPRNEAAALANLGAAYSRIGDGDEALRYLEPALALSRTIVQRTVEANVLAVLGMEAYRSGDLERSRGYFQQALAIQTAIKDVRGQVTTLRYLATTQLAAGAPAEALASITKSLEQSKESGASAIGLATLADVQAALGRDDEARGTYARALERARQLRAADQEASVLALFGRFEAQHGRHAEARTLLEQGLTLQESLRNRLVDPDQRMSYASRSLAPYELYIDVLMELERKSPGGGFAAEAFRTAERARGRGLLELLATSSVDIRQGVDTALVDRERALRWNLNAKAAIQTRLLSEKAGEKKLRGLEKEIAELSGEWRETTTLIRQQSPAYASLSEPQPLGAAEVRGLLDADTVLLEFAPGETRSWLFALTPDNFATFALPPRQAIEDAARATDRLLTARQPVAGETAATRQTRIARADAELDERSRALSDLVLGPIGARLTHEWRGKRLAIVAAGALEYVPFAALPLPGAGGAPLVSANEIVALPSASSLALLRRDNSRRRASKAVAVFADPVFAADDPRVKRAARAETRQLAEVSGAAVRSASAEDRGARSFAARALEPLVEDGTRGSLARLPFSRAEALAVAAQVPRAALLQATDFDATLALATSGKLADYRVVHFATHGLINTRRPELSGLALSLVDADGRRRDGFLRLNTIYNMRLSADLVVLSACQTALGKEVAGEGLVGLTRGFMYAGAKQVIASLWQVSDVATAELMTKLYAGMLQRQQPPAAALRSAQLEMMRNPRWSSPYYWAGFVLQGDWTHAE